MRVHRYRVRVEALSLGADEHTDGNAISFEVANHDDVFAIVRRMTAANVFDRNEAAALAVGLKLFTGVMLRHRDDPLFAAVQPAMRAFIGNLKARAASSSSPEPSR